MSSNIADYHILIIVFEFIPEFTLYQVKLNNLLYSHIILVEIL